MIIKCENNNIVVEGVKCLDLALTLDCGQAFRWREQDDGSWSGVVKGELVNVRKEDERLIFSGTSKRAFDEVWVDYFDLNKDYEKICDTLKQDELISQTIDEYYGIRILNQDSWEALCTFVISQQNNIKRIKGIVERLCTTYGDRLENGWYTFPTAERLAELSVSDFEALGTGYRAKYLEALAKKVSSGEIDLEAIAALPLEQARKALLGIYGVGIKVANCALLFGMKFYDCVPVDVWMKRVMAYYPDGLPACFDGIGGIAQQYLFHWARNNLN